MDSIYNTNRIKKKKKNMPTVILVYQMSLYIDGSRSA